MYDISLQQYRRGSLATARTRVPANFCGFFQLMSGRPTPSSTSAKSFEQTAPDSAARGVRSTRASYPKSPRAPSALYKLGLLAEQRGDKATARTFYSRVITVYPRSPRPILARQNQQRSGLAAFAVPQYDPGA